MAGKGEPIPGDRCHGLRVVLVEAETRKNLGAHARGGIVIEAG
jgi:hypothetical protein